MKKIIFLLSIIVMAVQAICAQSSWYNPNGAQLPQQNSYNGPAWEYKEYQTNFSNGSHFSGVVELQYGKPASYKGCMKFPNGDSDCGTWNASWQPTASHDYYRKSDYTQWVHTYDSYGNLQSQRQIYVQSSPAPSSSGYSSGNNPCGVCNHTGKCSNCNGKGISPNHASGITAPCGACGGTGKCATCHGTGYHN